MVPNARFLELLSDAEPSPTTITGASAAHRAVRDHLRTHEDFKSRWKRDFLAGSYARDTAIRPTTSDDGIERPDVDTIIVTSFALSDSPEDVLNELADALEDEFNVERINKRSVRLHTPGAEIDVVPVVEWSTAFQLPDRDLGHWKATNPPGHIEWSASQSALFDGRFKPLVKLLKWWRRENPTGKRPKGFVLEVLASLHAPKDERHFGEAFTKMLESIHSSYAMLASLDLKPSISDPSLGGSDILSKVSITDWKSFLDRVRVHAGYARRAQDEEDMEEATRLWRRLFGDRFKPTANAAKAGQASVFASAPVGQFVFPPVSATPPNKPRGFA